MEKSSYRGVFKHLLNDGSVVTVQVQDSAGNGNNISAQEYIDRNIQPPIEILPNQFEHQATQGK